MPSTQWDTSITHVEPNKVMVRGYPIDNLMGKLTFAQTIWLVTMGEIPDNQLSRLLEGIFVSSIDHGASPPSCLAARTVASTGAGLSASVAAGIMSINKHHGGAIEGCYLVLNSAIDIAKSENLSYEDAASRIIDEFKANKKFIPGFGHRLHTADPRTARLKELAKESGYSGDCLRMAEIFERHFEKSGRSIPLNVDGALGAILGDLGVPHEMMNGFFMIARLPGLLTHVHEETTTMKPMRKIHPTDFNYTGPEERKV